MDIGRVALAFLEENGNDLPRANHSLKVYGYAKAIAAGEALSLQEQQVLEAGALLHDVGIHEALLRYGHCQGPAQEEMGPPIVRGILTKLGWPEKQKEQVAFLVGHHHSYQTVGGGVPLQILFEADLLVNAEEGAFSAPKPVFFRKAGNAHLRWEETFFCSFWRSNGGKDVHLTLYSFYLPKNSGLFF